ncbi:MAG: DUF1638 domain-containing protein [Alphaproteobacteria bacterium]|nr:DUF1638 domain-containing protein [Alphaproteobacteria bacterium]
MRERKPSLIIACGALVREIRDVLGANRLGDIHLQAIPALYHNRPEKIAPAVAKRIAEARAHYDQIFVAYAECGTGGELDRVISEMGVERLPGAHCYAFFTGVETFADGADDMRSFYLTDFLVRQFDSIIMKGLGLDRHPELRDAYFGNYEKIVYLSQAPTSELMEKAKAAAGRLGLGFEHRPVGYGDLESVLDDRFARI